VLYQRFITTDALLRMPPVGTEIKDASGQQIIADWATGLQ
jgi:hypothetical protein